MKVNLKGYYRVSENVITREIEGDLVIVPLVDGVGNLDSEMYSLNPTGAAIWNKLFGKAALEEVINELAADFGVPNDQITADVLEIVQALLAKGLVVEI